MFSRMQLLASAETITSRFAAQSVCETKPFLPKEEISGFDHTPQPVILDSSGILICDQYHWGLVPPDWRKNPDAIWNHTISAKLEYVSRRYAWQKVVQQRVLIPGTAYFEYHWKNAKGHSKTKYMIQHASENLFALAGLYAHWRNSGGNILKTFAVCTTEANEIMRFVHNKDAAKNYHRMPVMLNRSDEMNWLDASIPHMDFMFPNYKPELIATPVIKQSEVQTSLFE